VPKPALGRGLGNLLGDTQIARQPEPLSLPLDAAAPAEVSPGLGNLLRGGKPEETAEPPTPVAAGSIAAAPVSVYRPAVKSPPQALAAAPEEPVQAPRWSLAAADLLLVALATLLVFKSPAPLKAWEMAICISAVVLGALLACAAVMGDPRRK
jgi:hypothetical protein